jgi:hypothetical protein
MSLMTSQLFFKCLLRPSARRRGAGPIMAMIAHYSPVNSSRRVIRLAWRDYLRDGFLLVCKVYFRSLSLRNTN